MKRKKTDTPFPLSILQYMNRVAPRWTEYADIFVNQKGDTPDFNWDDLCVLPVGPGIAVAQECDFPDKNPVTMGQFMTQGRLFPLIIRSGVQDDHIPVRSPLRESVHPKGKWLFPDPDTLLSAKILESHTYHPS